MIPSLRVFVIALLIATCPIIASAQENLLRTVCTARALAALKPLPELKYECPEGAIDSDELILEIPGRLQSLRSIGNQLSSFTADAWWQVPVDELFYCQLHGIEGELTNEDKEELENSRFPSRVFGNDRFRLVQVFDPCYQISYNGSTWFLLNRAKGKVFVTKIKDGFFTRAENSISMEVGWLNGEPIIEISTSHLMPPRFVNYYFTINPKTNLAIPRKIIKEGVRLTNHIESAMLFDDPKALGLPADANVLAAVKKNRLVNRINVFEEDEHGKIENMGTNLRRLIYRWNGRFYSRAKR